ncbi:MAG: response regulator [Terriglobia bacterium]|jgi:CheY-like chemotaxis protein|nr:response regulator [Terriglobia bacterium]
MMSTSFELERDQRTVLCIDEEQPALTDRTALLESAGYRVFAAMNANAAMQLFVNHEIDLVLSNNHLRGVSGAELSIFMKQVKPVSVVLLSNSAQIPANLLSLVDACIEQDGSPKDLLRCLRRVLPTKSAVQTDRALLLKEA